MTSEQLERSTTWAKMSAEIAKDTAAGIPFERQLTMNVAIKQGTLAPYQKHRTRLDELVWNDDPAPKTVIELGGGYGAMATMWPPLTTVYDVDLPEMLTVARSYLTDRLGAERVPGSVDTYHGGQLAAGVEITLVPFTEADRLPFDGAYFFATWSLTETTMATWAYYTERAPRMAGIYAVGWHGWIDEAGVWPWEALRDAFKTVRADLLPYLDYDGAPTDSVELAAVNR